MRSSTRRPSSGRWSLRNGGSARGGASPMRSMVKSGCLATACPCGVASHSSKRRSAVATRPWAAAADSKSIARQPAIAASASARVAMAGSSFMRRSAPSRWCLKFAWIRTHPSAQRYMPEKVSHSSGTRPSRLNQPVQSSAACSVSTATSWRATPRRCPSSQAASAAAAMLACAARPTAKDDGSTGSAPVSRAKASASAGNPASCQRPARTSSLVAMRRPFREGKKK
ncbi:hypothetical protein FQZ97_751990 [compost metagenome]